MSLDVYPYKDEYWVSRGNNKFLSYTGPHLKQTLDPQDVRNFLRKRGAWGAMWNYDHDYAQDGPWYRVVCDSPNYDASIIKSKNARHNVRRSLKRCTFRQVDHQWLADNAYQVYVNAASRYSNFTVEPQEQFRARMRSYATIPGAEAFGVFVKGELVAYVTLFICGQNVRGDIARFDPAYSSSYPMYALYYSIAQHYLKDGAYKDLDCGSRPLLHETNIGDFLLHMGYRKTYCRLGVFWVGHMRVALRLLRFFRPLCKFILPARVYANLQGLLLAQDIAKQTGN